MMEIDKDRLIKYIAQIASKESGTIVYQQADSLIDVLPIDRHNNLMKLVMDLNVNIVDKNDLLDTCFSDLANWSTSNDLLIFVGSDLLICLPKSDAKDFVIEQC